MARRLPPLNALRAFEAAARHLSFTKAAGELSVTPAAVSHQVKALEDYFGIQLFRRLTRALLLTDAGQTALPALRDGFDKLAEASERLRAHDARGMLTVSVSPSFAAKWLVPRLDDFRTVHPDIDLRLDASDTIVDLARGEADLSIRYGPGGYRDLRVDLLFEAEVFPVCAPGLCDGQHPLREPADLHRHTLLHVDWSVQAETWPGWRMWLLAAGAEGVDATRGPRFSQESMAVQSAVDGHGVALTSSALVTDDIAAGRLIRPFDLSLPLSFGYYLLGTEATIDHPKVAAFRDWILAAAG